MTSDPYAPPQSELNSFSAEPTIPDAILKKIKNAWIAGLISGVMTLLLTLLAIAGTSILGFSVWELLDVFLVFGLAFGIYKKSRVCAVVMLIYFVSAKIILSLEAGKPVGIVLGLVFIYYYSLGVVGTFQYHKLVRAHKNDVSVST